MAAGGAEPVAPALLRQAGDLAGRLGATILVAAIESLARRSHDASS